MTGTFQPPPGQEQFIRHCPTSSSGHRFRLVIKSQDTLGFNLALPLLSLIVANRTGNTACNVATASHEGPALPTRLSSPPSTTWGCTVAGDEVYGSSHQSRPCLGFLLGLCIAPVHMTRPHDNSKLSQSQESRVSQ